MAETSKKRFPWFRIVLAVSLAINLLVAGAFIGAKFSGKDPRKASISERIGFSLGPYGRALTESDRQEMARAFRTRASELRQVRSEMRNLGGEVVTAVRAETFDPDRVSTLLSRQIELTSQIQAIGSELLIDRLDSMEASERTEFAEKLDRILKRGPARKDRQ